MSKYIRKNGGSKVTLIFAVILAAIIIAWVLLETTAAQRKEVKPDVVYRMANANVSWSQTFHKGAWGR